MTPTTRTPFEALTAEEKEMNELADNLAIARELEAKCFSAIRGLRMYVDALKRIESDDVTTVESCKSQISYLEEKARSYSQWIVRQQPRMTYLIKVVMGEIKVKS